jgi:hypothetical protein
MRTRWRFMVNPHHALARAKRVSIADLGEELFVAHNVPSPLRKSDRGV